MAFDTISDSLIVMHSFEGIFQVDLKTGEKKRLVTDKDVVGEEVREEVEIKLKFHSKFPF